MILHIWHMHIVNKSYGKKKLKDYDENPNYTYFEKRYGRKISLGVYFPTNNTMCMQLTRVTTSDVVVVDFVIAFHQ